MPELVGFAVAAAAVLGIGIAIGMLVAPVLVRWTQREDADAADHEEPGAGEP